MLLRLMVREWEEVWSQGGRKPWESFRELCPGAMDGEGSSQGVGFANCLNFKTAWRGLFQWSGKSRPLRTSREGITIWKTHLKSIVIKES